MPHINQEEIQEYLRKLVDSRFEAMNARIFSIQKTLDVLASDLDKDRGDISQFSIALKDLSHQVAELARTINTQPRKIAEQISERVSDKVVETVQPVVEDSLNHFTSTKPRINRKRGLERLLQFLKSAIRKVWRS